LAEEFREYSTRGGQVFISSHSPDFVNAIDLDELFWLSKTEGYSQIIKASENPEIRKLVEAGDLLGSLWKQKYLPGSGPNL